MRTRKAKPGVTRPEVRDMTMHSVHLGHCSKCQMTQCLDSSSNGLMAKLMLASGGTKYTLCAFGKVVTTIADTPSDQITITTLLKAKPFKMIHVDGIIQSVSRKP